MNAKLSYSIVSGNDGRAFGIKSDGRVTIERGLDRESVQNYQLKINVVDGKYLEDKKLLFYLCVSFVTEYMPPMPSIV